MGIKSRKKHIDFQILDSSKIKVIMRFYPRRSNMRGFNEEVPKSFDEVYKVYYSWAILESRNMAWEDEEPRWGKYKKVFSMNWDECSVIFEVLSGAIKSVIEEKEKHLGLVSLGQPSSEWILEYHEVADLFKENLRDWVSFMVFNNWTSKGYRFNLGIDAVEDFKNYLNDINSYMLRHSVDV